MSKKTNLTKSEITKKGVTGTFKLHELLIGGNIYNDTATHGNHPFPEGAFINTSVVTGFEVVDNELFIKTRNSIYKVITQ